MKFWKTKAFFIAIIGVLVLSGCSKYEQALLAEALVNNQLNNHTNNNQYNNYYRDGEIDGCNSYKNGYAIKDNYKWNYSRNYRTGWYRGYNKCKQNSTQYNYYNKGYRDGCLSKKYRAIHKNYKLYNTNYIEFLEFQNTLTLAEVIIKNALEREESCGAHFRDDFKGDVL